MRSKSALAQYFILGVQGALPVLCRLHAHSSRCSRSSSRSCGRSVSNGIFLCCIGLPYTVSADKGDRPHIQQGRSAWCRGVLRNSCAASGDCAVFDTFFVATLRSILHASVLYWLVDDLTCMVLLIWVFLMQISKQTFAITAAVKQQDNCTTWHC